MQSEVTLSEGGTVDAIYGEPMPNIQVPEKKAYIFDGYYDENGVKYYNADGTSAKLWDKTGDAKLYARWIEGSPSFGTRGVYMRNIEETDEDGNTVYRIYIFAGVDTLKYKEVGFEIEAGGKKYTLPTTTVFRRVVAKNTTVLPSSLGSSCNAIFAYTIIFHKDMKGQSVTYRPYAVTKKGEYSYGKYVTIDCIYKD